MLQLDYKNLHAETKEGKRVAAELADARQSNRMSQKELASLINTGQSVISDYETGKRIPSIKILERYEKAGLISHFELMKIDHYRKIAIEKSSGKRKARINVLEARMTY